MFASISSHAIGDDMAVGRGEASFDIVRAIIDDEGCHSVGAWFVDGVLGMESNCRA